MNASIYAWNRKCLLESDSIWNEQTRLYVMSEEAMDIDSLVDFEMVELMMNRNLKPPNNIKLLKKYVKNTLK